MNSYLAVARQDRLTLEAILEGRGGAAQSQETPRGVRAFVVGTGQMPGLDLPAGYLSGTCGVPISVVLFGVFRTSTGQTILVRELPEEIKIDSIPVDSVDKVRAKAEVAGVGEPFRAILAAARGIGLRPKQWKSSIMYSPATGRPRCLFTLLRPVNVGLPKAPSAIRCGG